MQKMYNFFSRIHSDLCSHFKHFRVGAGCEKADNGKTERD